MRELHEIRAAQRRKEVVGVRICPTCQGLKKTIGYACPGFRRVENECGHCAGTGSLNDEQASRYEQGNVFRARRIAAMKSTREVANQLGVTPVQLSKYERGEDVPEVMSAIARTGLFEA